MKQKEKGLSAWQLTMMTLGSVVGGTFFLGAGVAIKAAGPAIIISYILGGFLVYFILYALSEMTVANPDSGSFYIFTAQVFGPGSGFVVGWVYWTGTALAMSSEATAIAILVKEWFPDVSIPILGSSIIIVVTLMNLLGADKLSTLESGLAIVKVLAIVAFIIIALLLVLGMIRDVPTIGIGELAREPFMPGGFRSIAGSMLIVMFSYAGFEIIGLASSEAENPHVTIPKAIAFSVTGLVGLYILSIICLLPLIPTNQLSENMSPMVAALERWGMDWAGQVINFILLTAMLSTLLAAMFSLGRMIRSLADENHAPKWLKDRTDVPYRGILFSGLAMLLGLGLGMLFPRVYLFLISSGGFAALFTYTFILATHIRFRKINGCPPEGKCQMPGYPYTSWIALLAGVTILFSMPFIPGQTAGLITGIAMVAVYALIYQIMKMAAVRNGNIDTADRINGSNTQQQNYRTMLSEEYAEEFIEDTRPNNNSNNKKKTCNCNKNIHSE